MFLVIALVSQFWYIFMLQKAYVRGKLHFFFFIINQFCKNTDIKNYVFKIILDYILSCNV